MSVTYDVLGIGNAIVDIIARTEDDILVKHAMNKGSMALIDEPRAEAIYASMGPAIEISGGSAANTIAGVASFSARGAFVGKVKDDALGKSFSHNIQTFRTPHASDGPSTARCFVQVTPDGERTMNTYLGAAQNLSPSDLDEKQIAAASIVYLEGYLWDPPKAKEAFRKAAEIAHAAGCAVALTLSDSFCVDRYRDEFLNLMRTGAVDLIFANESELKSLYQTSDFDSGLAAVRSDVKLAVVTRSEKGCVVVSRESKQGGGGSADQEVRRRDRSRRPVRFANAARRRLRSPQNQYRRLEESALARNRADPGLQRGRHRRGRPRGGFRTAMRGYCLLRPPTIAFPSQDQTRRPRTDVAADSDLRLVQAAFTAQAPP